MKDFLIVEIKSRADVNKEYFLNVKHEEVKICSTCEEVISKNCIYPCKECEQYFYCSLECKEKDLSHINYHMVSSNLEHRKVDLKDIVSLNISEILPSHSRRGQMGMKNLGNTCFMNSAIQCLSHCEEITKYFLIKKFKEEINPKNKYGSGGQIAVAYYELVKELWTGSSYYLSPWDFRQIFVGFVKQFAGFSQHDSHEMLAFILDALHEDLNRVKEKPYEELVEKKPEENEEDASTRWWKNHLKRENSIIVDFFHGQYKSEITCPDCKRISITYDPFMYLGLPIPTAQSRLKFKFFLLDSYYIQDISIKLTKSTTVKDMKLKASETCGKKHNKMEAVLCGKNYNFVNTLDDDEKVYDYFLKEMEVVLYETEYEIEKKNQYFTCYIVPGLMREEVYLFGKKRKVFKPIFFSMPIQVNRNATIKEIYYKIFRFYRKLLPDLDGRPLKKYLEEYSNKNEDYIHEEFMLYFKNPPKGQKLPYNLKIVNNNFTNKYNEKCEFCETRDCENCAFNYTFNERVSMIINTMKVNRPFALNLEISVWRENLVLHDNFDKKASVIQGGGNVTLYDCLDQFKAVEQLEKDNTWYCNICKEHKEAFKKLDIFRAPNILIMQLKRFKIKSGFMGFQESRKNECLVDFPVHDLDLSNYIVGPNKNAKYDLFAISQHFGGLGGGHYKALCRSGNSWFEFDDETVSSYNSNIVNPSGYILFYRKKQMFS